jgi:hypothetical protein
MKVSSRAVAAGAVALAVLAGPVRAEPSDAARIRELEKKLERSLELIEHLSAKISRIEQASAGARDVEAKAAQQTAKIEAIEKHVSELGAGASRRASDAGESLHGFVDVGFARGGKKILERRRSGAMLGMLDLYLTPSFGRVRTLVELALEAESGGDAEADLERMQIGYSFNDTVTAWAGRFHTPYGYWNTAFHHGAQIQTSVLRPIFLEFENDGGILPAHTVGVWLTGATAAAKGRIGYDLFAGNAPRLTGVTPGSRLASLNANGFSGAVNAGGYAGSGALNFAQTGSLGHRTSLGFNAWFQPETAEAVRFGVHGLRADVADDAATPNRTQLRMLGGYFAYQSDRFEALGEYYRFRNQDRAGNGAHGSWAGYAQLAHRLGRWTPYVRLERAELDQTDNYFGVLEGGRSYRRAAAGLRYDIDPKAALKAEFDRTRKELAPGLIDRYPELRLQYAIRF